VRELAPFDDLARRRMIRYNARELTVPHPALTIR